jgi:hypothetical protein
MEYYQRVWIVVRDSALTWFVLGSGKLILGVDCWADVIVRFATFVTSIVSILYIR